MSAIATLRLAALILLILTSLGLLISRDWRWSIATLAVQYIGVFGLVSAVWPVEMAVAKMIAGWMAGAILGLAAAANPEGWGEEERFWPSGRLLRLFAAAMVVFTILSLASQAQSWFSGRPVGLVVIMGGFILIGMGILHLGLTANPMRTIIGLLTALAGFEILYAAVENSALVAGLLAIINLGLAVAGAYLLAASAPEVGE